MKPILPLLLLSILALLLGLWAGLVRIGWTIPALPALLPSDHGPLMVSGFLGTLITLERVAALRRPWMFAAPALTVIGWILSLSLPGSSLGPLLITLGSLFATAILVVIFRREPKIYTLAMLLGVASWLVGNVLWLSGKPIFQVVWIWAAFLVLTISGERVELSRVLRFKTWHLWVFALAAIIFLLGAIITIQLPRFGSRVFGIGLLALATWLVSFDIARRNLRHRIPLTRFIATCLFTGYLWLGVSSLLILAFGPQVAGFRYDADLHSIFVGFVFSMIFGHALIILPALTRFNVHFRPLFYLPLVLLHASLLLRVAADLASWQTGRMWGGLLNEIAILVFIGILLYSRIRDPAAQPRTLK